MSNDSASSALGRRQLLETAGAVAAGAGLMIVGSKALASPARHAGGAARKRLIKTYSKGMQQRIGLAQALINDPDLLILDEPTSGLDPIGRMKVREIIQRLKNEADTFSRFLDTNHHPCPHISFCECGHAKLQVRVGSIRMVPSCIGIDAACPGRDSFCPARVAC